MGNEDGTMERPFTKREEGAFHGGKYCKCHECGTVEVCTPARDFWVFDDTRLQKCESCFHGYVAKKLKEPRKPKAHKE
jgi:hypothetical protein